MWSGNAWSGDWKPKNSHSWPLVLLCKIIWPLLCSQETHEPLLAKGISVPAKSSCDALNLAHYFVSMQIRPVYLQSTLLLMGPYQALWCKLKCCLHWIRLSRLESWTSDLHRQAHCFQGAPRTSNFPHWEDNSKLGRRLLMPQTHSNLPFLADFKVRSSACWLSVIGWKSHQSLRNCYRQLGRLPSYCLCRWREKSCSPGTLLIGAYWLFCLRRRWHRCSTGPWYSIASSFACDLARHARPESIAACSSPASSTAVLKGYLREINQQHYTKQLYTYYPD